VPSFQLGHQFHTEYLSCRDIRGRDSLGAPVVDDSFLAVLHAGDRPTAFVLPGPAWAQCYELVEHLTRGADSATGEGEPPGTTVTVPARGVLLLRVSE
jgi:glycogen operon protein